MTTLRLGVLKIAVHLFFREVRDRAVNFELATDAEARLHACDGVKFFSAFCGLDYSITAGRASRRSSTLSLFPDFASAFL